MRFKIDYTDRRSPRFVDGSHFAASVIGHATAQLRVGAYTKRFYSAGYRRITRVA